ncbi:hypothetical protein [Spiroplasma sp. AdecLV25b]|uniref:hypothetical protein n=1 Tax=Spiroplasma sp. AdecLV25b TaxID=3027162 RepID=UPI0027DFD395|nr:hypothetical protein [Spiroplasma sp. AdecLV25b]
MLYKNYAINYIFDSSNNLIEIYYSNWNTDNLTLNINANDNVSADSFNYGYNWWWSDPKSIVNWKKIY